MKEENYTYNHKSNCLISLGVSCGSCPERKVGCLVCHPVECTCNYNFADTSHQPKEEKCDCEEFSCKEDCKNTHTHKGFWCEKCHPERYQEPLQKDWGKISQYIGRW